MSDIQLAILGGKASFQQALPIGQLYFPEWDAYERAMRGIFDRQYYTNQGPLTQQLEERLQHYLGVKHAICVTNATIGLMMAAEALELEGKVATPAFSFIATSQSLSWTGLEPVFCDVDPVTHQLCPERLAERLQQEKISAILAVNLWGDTCNYSALEKLASEYGIPLYYDSAHAFGCAVGERQVGNFGSMEVFSFHATKVLSAAEGGCVCTNDDVIAGRLRNIRSSYGAGAAVPVKRTSNGRMSEAQAAIALLSLEEFPAILERNGRLFTTYEEQLKGVDGVHLVKPLRVSKTNYQYVVCEIDSEKFGLTRDQLIAVLSAENVKARRYFYPGIHRCPPYGSQSSQSTLAVTEALCDRVLQLPIGNAITEADAARIAAIIRLAGERAEAVRNVLGS